MTPFHQALCAFGRLQVLYMSSCGILWSAYLSFTSYTSLRDLLARNAKPALPAGGPTKAAPSPAPSKVKR